MTNPDDTIYRVYFGVAAFRAQTDLKYSLTRQTEHGFSADSRLRTA